MKTMENSRKKKLVGIVALAIITIISISVITYLIELKTRYTDLSQWAKLEITNATFNSTTKELKLLIKPQEDMPSNYQIYKWEMLGVSEEVNPCWLSQKDTATLKFPNVEVLHQGDVVMLYLWIQDSQTRETLGFVELKSKAITW